MSDPNYSAETDVDVDVDVEAMMVVDDVKVRWCSGSRGVYRGRPRFRDDTFMMHRDDVAVYEEKKLVVVIEPPQPEDEGGEYD